MGQSEILGKSGPINIKLRIFKYFYERTEWILSIGRCNIRHLDFQLDILSLFVRSIDLDPITEHIVNNDIFHFEHSESLMRDVEKFSEFSELNI